MSCDTDTSDPESLEVTGETPYNSPGPSTPNIITSRSTADHTDRINRIHRQMNNTPYITPTDDSVESKSKIFSI